MKFTALEEYGIRCLLRLAQRQVEVEGAIPCGSDPVAPSGATEWLTIGEIAREEGLTEQYAGKIFRVLQKARLVESVRGRKGGYRLARQPSQITLAQTLSALGGRLFDGEVCGRYTGDRHVCVRSTDCAIRSLWRELQSMMDRVLERTTLRDLIVSEQTMSLRLKAEAEEAALAVRAPTLSAPALINVGRFGPPRGEPTQEERT